MQDMLLTAHTVRMGALTLVLAMVGIGALIVRFIELIDHVDKPPAVDPADELRAGDDLEPRRADAPPEGRLRRRR